MLSELRGLKRSDWVARHNGRNRLVYQSVTSTSGAASTSASFTYDKVGSVGRVGKLLSATSGRRTTTYTWHPTGQLASEQVAISGVSAPLTTSYGYDADGVLTSLTLPSGFGVTYTPNKAMEIQEVKVTGSNRPLATQIAREPGGPIATMSFGNGEYLIQTHNLRYEPDAIFDAQLFLTYSMGLSGNVDKITERADQRAFTHDLLGRLATMTPGHGPGTPTLTYKYSSTSGDRVVQALEETTAGQVPRYAFGYDAVGNLSAVSTYTGAAVSSTTCLLHDAASRLVAVGPAKTLLTSPGGTACQAEADVSSVSTRFEYDAWNRRVGRLAASSGTREFIHDPAGHLLAEMRYRTTSAGNYEASRDYVWLDGKPLAQLEYPGPPGRAEGYTYYFHLDHLGLPRVLSNEDRVSVWSAIPSRPYSDVAELTAADPLTGRVITTELRLPGQYDERIFAAVGLSGLQGPYQNWNRWYLPTMGRYLELDPIAMHGGFNGPFGPNWYGYAEGNPLRFTDPLGLDAEMCYRRFSPIFLMPYARHCFVRFNGDDKDTMSYDNSRVGPDQGFGWLSRTCTKTSGQQNDACVKREMGKCDPKQYDFTGFNCCHCVEQAFNICGLSVPVDSWPNWPVNPGPQPGEQGSCAKGPPSNACSERR